MQKKHSYRFRDPTDNHHTHEWFAAVIAAGVGAAGSIASAAIGAGAAKDAAGTQRKYAQQGIDALTAALGPAMARLAKEQNWSDSYLRGQMQKALRELQPYRQAGQQGLSRLSYLLGTDTGLGPAPTAPKPPTAPKEPRYNKDPVKAAAQRKAFEKQQRIFGRQQLQFQSDSAKYATDLAGYRQRSDAASSDPAFGSLMKQYSDRFEGQIGDVSKRQFVDKYGQEIIDTSKKKFGLSDFEADPGYGFRRSEGQRGIEQSAAARGSLLSGSALKELERFNQDTASNEFDRAYGRWGDVRNSTLGALRGQQGFDYGVFGDQKTGELNTLINQRNFDFGNWQGNRDFQYNSLMGQVGIGQDAIDDRNQLREYFGGQRTQNRLSTATQQGNWQTDNARQIADFLSQIGNAQAAGQIGAANAQAQGLQGLSNAALQGANLYFQNQSTPRWRSNGSGAGGRNFMNDNGYIVSY